MTASTANPHADARWRRSRMFLWVVLLGPLGVVAYRYRWVRFALMIIAGSIWIYAGGWLPVGLAFFVLPAMAVTRRFFRGVRWYLALRNQ